MNLLAVNLQRPSAISSALYGNFSGPKQQEIVAVKGNTLELLRPDDTGKVISVCTTNAFSIIRSIATLRLPGANKDMVVIGSDSGKISIVEFDAAITNWKVLHCEVFGRTGCRRIVPGQYVATDPKGRAIMIAGIEKQKFVYVTNRDANNKLTISSPLEAHKSETILFSVCGVDVNFDNPVFAMIELEYTEADQDPTGEAMLETEKKLSYYELDLGLNHVVRKWSEPISRTANFLLSVPGGDQWPSGVLICGENWVSYKHMGHVELRTALPRRHDIPPERGVLITTGTVHKQKDMFFFILQSEYGDLYKVVLELNPSNSKQVENVVVTLFDSIQPANSLCITKTGLLFAASEFANHALFQFQGIGDPDAVRSERIADDALNEELGDDSLSASRVAPIFKASTKLKNLLMTDDIHSLAPITDLLVDDLLGEGAPQIVTLCGQGLRSTLRILKHGVSITEIAVSELPGRPIAVWTVKRSHDDDFDRYIIVSFSNATLVLSIGETVEEVSDSGILATSPTLSVALLADNALIQVHTLGIRHIRSDQRISEWKSPGKRPITMAAANSRQVAIALSGGELTYFEMDEAGQLIELGSETVQPDITAIELGVVPRDRVRSMFLAVGRADDTVQLLFLDPMNMFGKGPIFRVDARPTSLCLIEMEKDVNQSASSAASTTTATASKVKSLYLNIGLENGVLVRLAVDPLTGDFSDPRQKFLGPKAIKLCRVTAQESASVMALSARAWLMYNYQNRYYQDPLSYEALEHVSDFASVSCPSGIVAVAGSTLRIVTIDNLGAMFNQTILPLRYTPRKFCRVPDTSQIVIVEADHNEYSHDQYKQLEAQYAIAMSSNGSMDVETSAAESKSKEADADLTVAAAAQGEEEEEEEEEGARMAVRGPIPAVPGMWGSCVRLLDVATGQTSSVLELSENEAALSVCTCCFSQHSEETFIVVGTCKDLLLHPKKWTQCFIHVYRLLDSSLQLIHKTEVEQIPLAMIEFQGRLLVGLGRVLRMFDMGKKKLLKKCEIKSLPSSVVKLQCSGDRIFVGDLMESVHLVKYKRHENVLVVFADEAASRYITSLTVLDYNTVGCVDKFGNVFTLRLPDDASDSAEPAAGLNQLWDHGQINSAPNRLEVLTHYYLGETATAVTRTALKPQGKEVMLVATISGGIYALLPARTKEEASLFEHLEMFLRQEYSSLCRRDHLSYRSYFQPVKHTVDGDLCEQYPLLPFAKQREFADDVERSPAEIIKKLEELRDFV